MGVRCGVELLLILFAGLEVLGIITTYIISVARDHVQPFLPPISNTGNKPPESCVFSLVLSIGALLAFVILWIRYRHIKCHYGDSPARVQLLNCISFFFGFLTVVGTLLVGSFQPDNVLYIHLLGAFTIFICGIVYCWIQTCISYRLRVAHPDHVGRCVLALRVAFSLLYLIFIALMVVLMIFFRSPLCRDGQEIKKHCKALPTLDASFEWLAILSYLLFLLTFHTDFTRIHVDLHVKLRHRHGNLDQSVIIDENTPLTL